MLAGLAFLVTVMNMPTPHWVKDAGLDVWNMQDVLDQTKASQQELRMLEAREEQLAREISLTNRVVQRLLDGSITLEAAAAEVDPILSQRIGFVFTRRRNTPLPPSGS
jgi:hypothetical protein